MRNRTPSGCKPTRRAGLNKLVSFLARQAAGPNHTNILGNNTTITYSGTEVPNAIYRGKVRLTRP
jgi:hypothetical protein